MAMLTYIYIYIYICFLFVFYLFLGPLFEDVFCLLPLPYLTLFEDVFWSVIGFWLFRLCKASASSVDNLNPQVGRPALPIRIVQCGVLEVGGTNSIKIPV